MCSPLRSPTLQVVSCRAQAASTQAPPKADPVSPISTAARPYNDGDINKVGPAACLPACAAVGRTARTSQRGGRADVLCAVAAVPPLPCMQTVLGIILGGGAGTRLYPLTKKRAKPAVPLGANYRLIDIPVSNCLNSNVTKIYCLTQFNSASLNRHLSQAYVSRRPRRAGRG